MNAQYHEAALALFRAGLLMTRTELALHLDTTEEVAERAIAELRGAGMVRRAGQGTPARYRVAERLPRPRPVPPSTVEHAILNVPKSVWDLGLRSVA